MLINENNKKILIFWTSVHNFWVKTTNAKQICKLIQTQTLQLNWFHLISPNIQSGMFINFQLTQLTSQDSKLQKKSALIKLLAPYCLALPSLTPASESEYWRIYQWRSPFFVTLAHSSRYTLDNLNMGRKNSIYLPFWNLKTSF